MFIEFQSQAPPGVSNTQQIAAANENPRTIRLDIYPDDANFYYDPDGNGRFSRSFSLSNDPAEQFGFTDLNLMKFSASGKTANTWYDSIMVEVVGGGPRPTDFLWKVDQSGDWNLQENWNSTGGPPSGLGAENRLNDTASFGDAIQSNQTVFSNTGVSVHAISFNSTNTYAIAGTGSVSLIKATAAGAPDMSSIGVLQGSHQFQVNVHLQNSTDICLTGWPTGSGSLEINDEFFSAHLKRVESGKNY